MAKETPMMKQYRHFKAQHKDSVMLFRMGDFYEVFFEDAETCARVLNVVLTSRSKGPDAIPMAGFPHHAADSYIRKLIQAGHTVAICEQVQDPKEAQGIVDRDVIRIMTPGTLTEDGLLQEKSNNYLAAVCINGAAAGLSWVDLSTGAFYVEDTTSDELPDALARVKAVECLVAEELGDDREAAARTLRLPSSDVLTVRPEWVFGRDTAERLLLEHFGTTSLEGFGCGELGAALSAAGAVIQYLQETQKTTLSHITRIRPFQREGYVVIDRATQRSLELVETMRDGRRENTLLWVLDRTATAMGARLLREWVLCPLREVEPIRERLEAVNELFENATLRGDLTMLLGGIYDIERIIAKINTGRANGRDLLALGRSLERLPPIKKAMRECTSTRLKALAQDLDPVEEAQTLIAGAIAPDPPPTIREGGLIREGYDQDLDELRSVAKGGKEWIANFQADETKRTGIPSLKVGFNKVFGYYIEVTNAHKDRIPEDYIRKQTLKNAERYITPELKEYESKVLTADERAQEMEYEIFLRIRDEVATFTPRLQQSAEIVAQLDVLSDLAAVAADNDYVMPDVNDELVIDIRDGRHPVLEKTQIEEAFVPNDLHLDDAEAQVAVITGPNMAGKSTYIRQSALLVLMAQIGSFIPASEAVIGVADRVFTRVGASDELTRGQSTFMVEMNETANILNNATDRSLIILDEVGRGTSTFDGVSIAWAVTEFICKHLKARTLFATHYHELTELALLFDSVKNYNIAVKEWHDQVVFLRKIVEGGTDKSYGIHVARLAGIPRDVIERAAVILANLETDSLDINDQPKFARSDTLAVKKPRSGQLSLFGGIDIDSITPEERSVLEEIAGIDTTILAPIEALTKLEELRKRLGQRDEPDEE